MVDSVVEVGGRTSGSNAKTFELFAFISGSSALRRCSPALRLHGHPFRKDFSDRQREVRYDPAEGAVVYQR